MQVQRNSKADSITFKDTIRGSRPETIPTGDLWQRIKRRENQLGWIKKGRRRQNTPHVT